MDKRIESYLDSVIPEKLSKRRQKLIREELRDHISDHIDFYTEIGYSEDESIQKALADMGDDGGVTAMVKKDFEKVYGEKNMDADFGVCADCRNRLAALSFRIVSLRHIIFGCVQRTCRVRGDARCVARYVGGIPKGLQKNGACNGTVRRSVRFAVYYSRPAAALYLFGLC